LIGLKGTGDQSNCLTCRFSSFMIPAPDLCMCLLFGSWHPFKLNLQQPDIWVKFWAPFPYRGHFTPCSLGIHESFTFMNVCLCMIWKLQNYLCRTVLEYSSCLTAAEDSVDEKLIFLLFRYSPSMHKFVEVWACLVINHITIYSPLLTSSWRHSLSQKRRSDVSEEYLVVALRQMKRKTACHSCLGLCRKWCKLWGQSMWRRWPPSTMEHH